MYRKPCHAKTKTGHEKWTPSVIVGGKGANNVKNGGHSDPACLKAQLGVFTIVERSEDLLTLAVVSNKSFKGG